MLREVILFANVLKSIQFIGILFILRHRNWIVRKKVCLYNLCLVFTDLRIPLVIHGFFWDSGLTGACFSASDLIRSII